MTGTGELMFRCCAGSRVLVTDATNKLKQNAELSFRKVTPHPCHIINKFLLFSGLRSQTIVDNRVQLCHLKLSDDRLWTQSIVNRKAGRNDKRSDIQQLSGT